MLCNGDIYDYVGVYVDVIITIIIRASQDIINILKQKYKYKLKGIGPISFDLGMDFYHDSNSNVLCISVKCYVERMVASYYIMLFGTKPNLKLQSLLEKGNHSELDDMEFLVAKQTQQYQSLVGALQWAISIGCFDISTPAIMTLSSFHAMPCHGHFECVKFMHLWIPG